MPVGCSMGSTIPRGSAGATFRANQLRFKASSGLHSFAPQKRSAFVPSAQVDTRSGTALLADSGLQLMQKLLPGLQHDKLVQATYPLSVGGASLWSGAAKFQRDGREFGCLCFVAAEDGGRSNTLPGLALHWGCCDAPGGGWKGADNGWVTIPDQSHDAGGNAWQTRFTCDQRADGTRVYTVVLQLPLDERLREGGVAFVLKTDNTWIKDGNTGRDLFASTGALKGVDSVSVTPTNGSHPPSDPSRPPAAPQDSSPARNAAKIEAFLESLELNGHDLFQVVERNLKTPESHGGPCVWMVDSLVSRESQAERSLMHRYDTAAELVDSALSKQGAEMEEALMAVAVWLRYAATRQLTWNRNYNVKPREISAAQERLANKLANIMLTRPQAHDAARLALVSTGRGGQGDVGQRIRDEILTVQSRNGAKGGMMEEWHQKLHNNTSPDDVVICQALLAYIRSGLKIEAYWKTLQAENITKERLASFDRAIVNEPKFSQQQCAGLEQDLEAYLVTLKAVHSGADLEAAAASVFGYKQEARKGRSISVPPVPGVATPRLTSLVEAILYLQNQSARSLEDVGRLLKLVVEGRWLLAPHLKTDCGGRLKDVLFLDMALDSAARTVVESSLGEMKSLPASTSIMSLVVNLLRPAVENAALSVSDRTELAHSVAVLGKAVKECASGAIDEANAHLLCLSAADRIRRHLVSTADSLAQRVQPSAVAVGEKLNIPRDVVGIFSEEVVRGTSAAPLAQLLAALEYRLRQSAGAGDWVVISRGTNGRALGVVNVEKGLAGVQHKVYEQPTVLVVEGVRGEEEVPEGAVAVISRECPDVLCHAAVRARNSGVLFACCENEEKFREICQALQQKTVSVRISGEDVVIEATTQEVTAYEAKPEGNAALQIEPIQWCGQWVLSHDQFKPGRVGGKSLSTMRLFGKLPSGVRQPVSAALPFGVFERLLQEPGNQWTAQALQNAEQRLTENLSELPNLRTTTMDVDSIPDIPETLISTLQRFGVGVSDASWDAIWYATRRVWASKWNERAALALRKQGVPLQALNMAVLVQELVPMEYAFVVHTSNPTNGRDDEMFVDIVRGMGETLVGNYPGKSLSAVVSKKGLPLLREQMKQGASIGDVQVSEQWARECINMLNYPSKTVALVVPAEVEETPLICRSDSNAEDLPSFAGAGLFDSHPTVQLETMVVDYTQDRLVCSADFRNQLIGHVALVCWLVEETLSEGPQDIEGGLSQKGVLYVVQSRPQV